MIFELAERLRRRETTSRALTEAALERIAARSPLLHTYITVCADAALAAAAQADRRILRGDAPPLCGIPMTLKDNIITSGIRTTCASGMLADFVPTYDAFAWERLREQGAVLLGKTNMDEFAMGAGGETSAFGACLNPLDPDCAAGGSSGGGAAAVQDGQAVYALGSDTGGSIRVPAAYCGVVGVKPTYGRVSRRGLIAFASSLDQIGVLSRSVRDSALVLASVSGADAGDMICADRQADFVSVSGDARGMRIGISPALGDGCSPAVREAYQRAAEALCSCGASLIELQMPDTETAYAAYYLISACEASSNLARYDGIRFGFPGTNTESAADMLASARAGFGDEVKRRLLTGICALSSEERGDAYDRACRTRRALCVQTETLFQTCDVILTPTVPDTAYRIGSRDAEALAYRSSDRFTVLPSLAGLPAVSIPAGRRGGMPVGVQLIAPAFREDLMYRAALALEEVLSREC